MKGRKNFFTSSNRFPHALCARSRASHRSPAPPRSPLSLEPGGGMDWDLFLGKCFTSPLINSEFRLFVKYSKLFGIFLLKLAADVESNIISATLSGIPLGLGCLASTSFLGNTCMCTSLFVQPHDVITSTWMKSCSTVAVPENLSVKIINKWTI